jgi:Ca-activated chloride channel family protein
MLPPGLHLARPWALVLLAAVPLAIWVLWLERRRAPRLRFPPAAMLRRSGIGLGARLGWLPPAMIVAALALTALALARPQERGTRPQESHVEGIDIVIAFDLSTSMKAADFKPQNRLHVAKEVLKEFIGKRRSDRIGLVTFAGDAYTQCPLTLDYGILRQLVDGLRFGVIEDGTAIGNAIALSVNRLRESAAKSKVVILITDGDNNAGQISPLAAAGIARSLGIKVFTILVGKGGVVPYPTGTDVFGRTVYEYLEFPVNPGLLQEIARTTGGAYYNATDRTSLEQGLNDILDRLEKTRLFETGSFAHVSERFPAVLGPAFGLAALGLLLGMTRFRPFP